MFSKKGAGLGSEMAINGTFDTDTDWSKQTGWTISGGTANCDGTQTVATNMIQASGLTIGVTYRIVFDVVSISAGYINILVGASGGTGTNRQYSTGTGITWDFVCAGNGNIYCGASLDFVGSIDNVSVKEIL